MRCRKAAKGANRICTVGSRTFVLHPGKRKKRRNTTGIRKYKFTKADARACKQRNPKARGRCMAKRVETRVG